MGGGNMGHMTWLHVCTLVVTYLLLWWHIYNNFKVNMQLQCNSWKSQTWLTTYIEDISEKSNLGFGPLGWLIWETYDGYPWNKTRVHVL